MKKIVLTGAPHSGKSTVIDGLAKKGYNVVPEAAIQVIEAIQALVPNGDLEWRRHYFESFQWLISQRQQELELQTSKALTFYDRGAYDGYGFAAHHGAAIPKLVADMCSKSTYDMVFLLDLVTPFDPRSDTSRIETIEDCKELQERLNLAYMDFGYEPVFVPLMSVEDRIEFILDRINKQ
tara:strand:+ start:12771 stop:13310 length:540 start_codon:yes stop_codon:yes gene_type:complete